MSINRREMCALIPALLPLATQLQAFGEDNRLPSGAFSFDKAPRHVANNNAEVRLMLRGKLATGEGIEVPVAVQQVVAALYASGGNHGVDGLSHSDTQYPQPAVISRGLDRDFLSSQFDNRQ